MQKFILFHKFVAILFVIVMMLLLTIAYIGSQQTKVYRSRASYEPTPTNPFTATATPITAPSNTPIPSPTTRQCREIGGCSGGGECCSGSCNYIDYLHASFCTPPGAPTPAPGTTGPCRTDADCDPSNYCRPTQAGLMCVPRYVPSPTPNAVPGACCDCHLKYNAQGECSTRTTGCGGALCGNTTPTPPHRVTPTQPPPPHLTPSVPPPGAKGTVQGFIFNDVNANAKKNSSESTIVGALITLIRIIGSSERNVAQTTSIAGDEVRNYRFIHVSDGNYKLARPQNITGFSLIKPCTIITPPAQIPTGRYFYCLDGSNTMRLKKWTPGGYVQVANDTFTVNENIVNVDFPLVSGQVSPTPTPTGVLPSITLTPTPGELTPTPTSVSPTITSVEPTNTPAPGCPKKSQGDANCDGNVDGVDYSIWLNTQCPSTRPTNAECASYDADFNGDKNIDDVDYEIWLQGSRL